MSASLYQWIKRWILPIGTLFIAPIIDRIVTSAIGPNIDEYLTKITSINIDFLKEKSEMISLLLTALIIGIIASWQVHKAQDKIKQLAEDNQWLLERYFIYKPIVDKTKIPSQTSFSAHMNLEAISPEEIRAIEIRERNKKVIEDF